MKKSNLAERELVINEIIKHVSQETFEMIQVDPQQVVNMLLMDVIGQLHSLSQEQLNKELRSWQKKHKKSVAFDFYN